MHAQTLVSYFFVSDSAQILLSEDTALPNGGQIHRNLDCVSPFSNPRSYSLARLVSRFSQLRRFSSSSNGSPPRDDSIPAVSLDSSNPPIDAGSSIRKPAVFWPGIHHSPVTKALWEARSSIVDVLSQATSDSPPKGKVTKSPRMSRTSVFYKFSTDYALREQYRNPWNMIRMGRLVEDLDALAGTISYKHCSDVDSTTMPLLLVTASVDKMVLKKPIRIDLDLEIEGAVTWVGRSSMEIQLKVTQTSPDTSNPLALTANFTFVARDSDTGRSALVNQISPETEDEILLWNEAEERNKMRKRTREEPTRRVDIEEVNRLNELLAEGRVFCDMPA
ncbi:unnamed protein product, partial [Cuscuta campestris]